MPVFAQRYCHTCLTSCCRSPAMKMLTWYVARPSMLVCLIKPVMLPYFPVMPRSEPVLRFRRTRSAVGWSCKALRLLQFSVNQGRNECPRPWSLRPFHSAWAECLATSHDCGTKSLT